MKTFKLLALCAAMILAPAVQAERLKDLASIAGVRQNQLMGYGLVVGLDGSGDQTTQTPFTLQTFNNMTGLSDRDLIERFSGPHEPDRCGVFGQPQRASAGWPANCHGPALMGVRLRIPFPRMN